MDHRSGFIFVPLWVLPLECMLVVVNIYVWAYHPMSQLTEFQIDSPTEPQSLTSKEARCRSAGSSSDTVKGECSAKDASRGDPMLGGQLAWPVARSLHGHFISQRHWLRNTHVSGCVYT